jgi:putative copper resistance protein D
VDGLIIASRLVHFAAAALLFGGPLYRLAIEPKWSRNGGRAVEVVAAIAALLSGLVWFAGVAATMAGGFTDALAPDLLAAVTFHTRFGQLWIGRLLVLVAILALHLGGRASRGRDGALVLLSAGFAASLVGVGHGMTGAGHGPVVARIHLVADMLHLLSAAGWIGGLFFLGRLLHAATRGDRQIEAVRTALRRFSRMGYWAVALVLVSGCINALVLVPRPASLIGSDYGRVLLLKLALVLAMVAIALVNRVRLTPPIMAGGADRVRRLWGSVLVEQGAALLVLAAVAWLGTIHPIP